MHKCYICKEPTTSIHHIRPRAEGGTNDPKNLVPLCVPHHDEAEEHGWSWIQQQRIEFKRESNSPRLQNKNHRPDVPISTGEHLSFDSQGRIWKVWGRDSRGIYAKEL